VMRLGLAISIQRPSALERTAKLPLNARQRGEKS
jgi:hypothetical protein